MKMKKAWCMVLAAMTFMSVMPAFAVDKKKLTVKLTFFTTGRRPVEIPLVLSMGGDTDSYYVESAEYTNAENQDTWTVGDVPEVKVELLCKRWLPILLYKQKAISKFPAAMQSSRKQRSMTAVITLK